MQFIPWRSKRVGCYLDLTIKFHDYSIFFTAFDVANLNNTFFKALIESVMKTVYCDVTTHSSVASISVWIDILTYSLEELCLCSQELLYYTCTCKYIYLWTIPNILFA